MDRSQRTVSAIEELRQIRQDARTAKSLDKLQAYFDRLQTIRRIHLEDLDLQVAIADIHQEIVERVRALRSDGLDPFASLPRKAGNADEEPSEAAEIPAEVPRIDPKSWQRVVGLAVFLAGLVLVGFFYLIQTARKINFKDETVAAPKQQAAQGAPAAVAPATPTLRLYTDLVPGTVTVDSDPPKDLTDGELVLDNLQPGQHSLKVAGRSGFSEFKFEVAGKGAPRVVGVPTASNVMAVLVSAQDGRGHLVTNAEHSKVLLDGKPAGEVGPAGLELAGLGTTEHDLQVTEDRDRQRFVLTYTPAPVLTVYVKSDPNAGTLVVMAGLDGAEVYINDFPYKRQTAGGQVRIPLKVGEYRIRVHKAGFTDPPAALVEIKKAEETPVQFHLTAAPEVATLQIKGAPPGTSVVIDKEAPVPVSADGGARITSIKPGDHVIEVRRDQFVSKKFGRTFVAGQAIVLSGPDLQLDKLPTELQPEAAVVPPVQAPTAAKTAPSAESPAVTGPALGERVHRGGGFVSYGVPKVPGRYYFQTQGRVGGFLKHSKLQWYAGYQDSQNYILFTLDGKHAAVRELREGQAIEWNRVPFPLDSSEWVDVDLTVRASSLNARVRTAVLPWTEIGTVVSPGRDFTQDRVGLYVPGNDEVAVANFSFSNR